MNLMNFAIVTKEVQEQSNVDGFGRWELELVIKIVMVEVISDSRGYF
jgi:hypothetical protein